MYSFAQRSVNIEHGYSHLQIFHEAFQKRNKMFGLANIAGNRFFQQILWKNCATCLPRFDTIRRRHITRRTWI